MTVPIALRALRVGGLLAALLAAPGAPAVTPAAATHGRCSPIVTHTGGDVTITMDCPGVPPAALQTLNRRLDELALSLEERLARAEDWLQEREKLLDTLRAMASGGDDPHAAAVEALVEAGQHEAAGALLDSLLAGGEQAVGRVARQHYARAKLHALAFEYDQALEHFEKAHRYRPDELDYAMARADTLADLYRYDEAVAAYREALTLEGLERTDQARIHNQLGRALEDLQDYAQAVASYEAAIALREGLRQALGEAWPAGMRNDLAAAYFNRGLVHRERGEGATAARDLAAARALAGPVALATGSFAALEVMLKAGGLRLLALPEDSEQAREIAMGLVADLARFEQRVPIESWPEGLRRLKARIVALAAMRVPELGGHRREGHGASVPDLP